MHGQQLEFAIDCGEMKRHVEAVHDGNDGWIALCQKPTGGEFQQRHYKYEELIQAFDVLELDDNTDCYFSVNSFYIPERLLENVRQIRALYADLDCHHLSASRARHVIDDTLICFKIPKVSKQIPSPSLVVKTGRGLQLYWLLEDLPKHAVPLWQIVQEQITERLRLVVGEMGLDIKVDNVSDIARILRLSGTNNTKAKKIARLIDSNGHVYRLDEMTDKYFPVLSELCEQKKKKTAHSADYGRTLHIYNLYSLHYARLNDLVKLLELRQGEIGGDECRRRMVFLYRYWYCCYMQDAVRALEAALEFNRRFTKPLPKKTVIRETESAEKAYYEWLSGETVSINGQAFRKGYNYKNTTLIRWLGITPEEEREMKTIISKDEKYRRNNERRNKSRYGKDENGLTAKQRQRIERDKRIQDMHAQNIPNREIAGSENVTIRTVQRIIERGRHF